MASEFVQFYFFFLAFEDPDEMFKKLKNGNGIDGILEEFFIGIESRKTKDSSQQLDITKFIRNSRGFGVAYRNSLFTHQIISDCLSNVIKFRKKDVLQITSDYIHDSRVRNLCVAFALSRIPVMTSIAPGSIAELRISRQL